MKTAFIVLDVMFAIGLLLTLLTGLPKLINYIRGCFGGRQKPLPKAKKKHRFAIIVPARNESAVIGKLLDSLDAQTFGVDHGDVFIAVESPDDPTCKIAADYGVHDSNLIRRSHWAEETLVKHGFNIGKQEIKPDDVVLIDATEVKIQRPKKDKQLIIPARKSSTF